MSHKSKKRSRNQKNKQTSNKDQTKMRFERLEDETIDECLLRMKEAGYIPIRRIEKPFFKEVIENGEKKIIPHGQQITFEGIKVKDEQSR